MTLRFSTAMPGEGEPHSYDIVLAVEAICFATLKMLAEITLKISNKSLGLVGLCRTMFIGLTY